MSTAQENFEINIKSAEELAKILMACNRLREEQQVSILLEQIKEMEKSYSATLKELDAVKTQLKDLSQGVAEAKRSSLSQIINETDARLTEQRNVLQKIGKSLNEGAKHIVEKFKQIGIKALNNVCTFLGIKEKLTELRDCARSNEMTMKSSVEKIEKVESELAAVKLHAKNVIRALAGKETAVSENEKKSKFFESLKAPYLKQQKKYAQKCEKLNKAIEKFDSLEKNANAGRNKDSVIEKLSDNKKILDSKAAEQDMQQQENKTAEQKDTRQQEKAEKQHDNAAR